jgi:hypothetical protein
VKYYLIPLLACFAGIPPVSSQPPASECVFIITTDGFRWQELFSGADPAMIDDTQLVKDPATVSQSYGAASPEERRKKLMPFFWSVIATQGQLYGNRSYHNRVGMSNLYWISYPGYNEILTGYADPVLNPNLRLNNKNRNILEFLNLRPKYKGKVVAFGSWNVFPYIINKKRSNIPVDCGYHNRHTQRDDLTFACAKEYIAKNHPSIVFLGFGATDEDAHARRYDRYLDDAAAVDRMIGELWQFVQTDPKYKDHTTFIITTDHGRGKTAGSWHTHGLFTKGSGETWLACLGAGIKPMGEMREEQQIYGKQLAATVSHLLGENFQTSRPMGTAIVLPASAPSGILASVSPPSISPPSVSPSSISPSSISPSSISASSISPPSVSNPSASHTK